MQKNILFIVVTLLIIGCNTNRNNLAKRVKELTHDRSIVYLTFLVEDNKIKKRILISNADMYNECCKEIDFTEDFSNIVYKKLRQKYIFNFCEPKKNLDTYCINTDIYNRIKEIGSPKIVFEKYFTPLILDEEKKYSVSKPQYEKFSIEEIKAAIAFLIKNGTTVWFLDYDEYTIYVPPLK